MSWIDVVGYFAAMITLATYSMKTMIPLRIAGICANCVFIVYGLLSQTYPTLLLHVLLLPLNSYRLHQMRQLVEKVKAASRGDRNMDWLKPFMTKRACRAGEVLFQKDALADEMFFTVSGRYRLVESGIVLGTGQVVGELGLLAPDQHRTQTLRCEEAGDMLVISYSDVKQLYYQNPEFGFYFLRLATGRLFQNLRDMEGKLAARDAPAAGV